MAQALLAGGTGQDEPWAPACSLVVARMESRRSAWQARGHPVYASVADLPADLNAYLLCVKPQDIAIACADLSASRDLRNSLIVSIVAGVSVARLGELLGAHKIIRSMPNTPAQVGHGCTFAFATRTTNDDDRSKTAGLFKRCGVFNWLSEESLLDVVTALSGSGPAYAYLMIEAMAEAATQMGLEPHTAVAAAAQTIYGAAKMVLDGKAAPADLRAQVTSKGGTTQQALQVLDDHGFARALSAAMHAAHGRAKELAQAERD